MFVFSGTSPHSALKAGAHSPTIECLLAQLTVVKGVAFFALLNAKCYRRYRLGGEGEITSAPQSRDFRGPEFAAATCKGVGSFSALVCLPFVADPYQIRRGGVEA